MFKEISKALVVVFALALLFQCNVEVLAQSVEPHKSLHYLVVDRSGSIDWTHIQLRTPITKAVGDYVQNLSEQDEVRLLFFNDKIGSATRFVSFDQSTKSEFIKKFQKEFKPGGNTHLYDAVMTALNDIEASANDYQSIRLLILSDGIDDRSRKVSTWAELDKRACDIKQKYPHCEFRWICIKFDPQGNLPENCIDVTKTDTIDVKKLDAPPVVRFDAKPAKVLPGEEVLFAARITGGTVTNISWSFGDGFLTNGPANELRSAIHSYREVGLKSVVLSVSGPGGRSSLTNQIEVLKLVELESKIIAPASPRVGETVLLNGAFSLGSPETFEWILPDGSKESGNVINWIPASSGNYDVSLSVGKGDKSHTSRSTIKVLPPLPSAEFSVVPAQIKMGGVFSLKATTSGDDFTYEWSVFGENGDKIRLGDKPVATWTPGSLGRFEIQLRVRGPGGEQTEEEAVFVLPAEAPVASFSITPEIPVQGQSVELKAMETKDDWSHTWKIGDATYSGSSVVLTGLIAGSYAALHEVSFNSVTGSVEQKLKVDAPPVADFDWIPENPKEGDDVLLIDKSANNPESFTWNINGKTFVGRSPDKLLSVEEGVIAVEYEVGLRGVKNKTELREIVVGPAAPVIEGLSILPGKSVDVTTPVTLEAKVRGKASSYKWSSSSHPGITGGGAKLSFTPDSSMAGKQVDLVVVVTGPGGTSTSKETVFVSKSEINPFFNFEPKSPVVGQPVVFTAVSRDGSHQWVIANQAPLSGSVVTSTLPAGSVTVVHRVDLKGQTTAFTQVVEVVKAPVSKFAVSPAAPKEGDVLILEDKSEHNPDTRVWRVNGIEQASTKIENVKEGKLSIELVVSRNGISSTSRQEITVGPAAPVIKSVTVNPADGIKVGTTVTLTAEVANKVSGYEWRSGSHTGISGNQSSLTFVADVSMAEKAVEITLVVEGPGGKSSPWKEKVVIVRPAEAMTIESPVGNKPYPFGRIEFRAKTEGLVTDVEWSILELGQQFRGASIAQSIEQQGTQTSAEYTIVARAVVPSGIEAPPDQTVRLVVVEPSLNPVIQFGRDSNDNERVNYRLQNDPISGSLIVSGAFQEIEWNFGDGSPVKTTTTLEIPAHQYAGYGSYVLTARAKRKVSGTWDESLSRTINVECVAPTEVKFDFVRGDKIISSASRGQTISLQDTTEGDVQSREWFVNGELVARNQSRIDVDCKEQGLMNFELRLTGCDGRSHDPVKRALRVFYVLPYYFAGALWLIATGFVVRLFSRNEAAGWSVSTAVYTGESTRMTTKSIPVSRFWSLWSKQAQIPFSSFVGGVAKKGDFIKVKASRIGRETQPLIWFSPKSGRVYFEDTPERKANEKILVHADLPEEKRRIFIRVDMRQRARIGEKILLVAMPLIFAALAWFAASYFV